LCYKKVILSNVRTRKKLITFFSRFKQPFQEKPSINVYQNLILVLSVFSAHQAPFILSPPDPKYPNPKTLAGGLFAEDASDGYKVKSESPSTEYILVEDFQADSIGSTFLEANLDRGSSLPSMELNFACIDWVSSSSARVQISPDPIGVTYVVRPRTDDPVDGAQGCLSNSGNTQNLL
jgi:hypothetical protein